MIEVFAKSFTCYKSFNSTNLPLLAAYAFTAAASGASVRGITGLVELPTRTR